MHNQPFWRFTLNLKSEQVKSVLKHSNQHRQKQRKPNQHLHFVHPVIKEEKIFKLLFFGKTNFLFSWQSFDKISYQ